MKGCPVLKNHRNSIKPGSGIIYVTPVLEDAACIFGMWILTVTQVPSVPSRGDLLHPEGIRSHAAQKR